MWLRSAKILNRTSGRNFCSSTQKSIHQVPTKRYQDGRQDASSEGPNSYELNFMKRLEQRLNIVDWRDWYKVSIKDIEQLQGGRTLLRKYRGSPSKTITTLYPQHPWNIGDFKKLPNNYWQAESNQRDFIKRFEAKNNISDWRDWYKVSREDLHKGGGKALLHDTYNGSISKMIMSIRPEHPWNLLEFRKVPHSYWGLERNRKNFMKILEGNLQIKDWKDWYRVKTRDLYNAGAGSLLNEYYDASISKMLISNYPEYSWDVLEFQSVPRRYWSSETNQRDFMKRLEEKLNIADWKDWYHITNADIFKEGGGTMLFQYYGGSPSKMIMSIYPQHPWNVFEFRCKYSWNPQMVQAFLNGVASHLHITSKGAWRTLSSVQLREFRGGNSLLRQSGSLHEALKLAFPTDDWRFLSKMRISKPQNAIVETLSKYISRDEVMVNHRHEEVIHKSGVRAELDIWIPRLNLAIEYHGEHHFHQLWERSQNPQIREKRDAEKRQLCLKKKIDLVEVPYWWDKSEEQLIAIIRGVRIDFLKSVDRFDKIVPLEHSTIREEGKLIISWHSGIEYSPVKQSGMGWYMSEKLDGVRCYWDGRSIFTRGSHPLNLLGPGKASLGKNAIDGELWYGRSFRLGLGISQLPEFVTFDAFCRKAVGARSGEVLE